MTTERTVEELIRELRDAVGSVWTPMWLWTLLAQAANAIARLRDERLILAKLGAAVEPGRPHFDSDEAYDAALALANAIVPTPPEWVR